MSRIGLSFLIFLLLSCCLGKERAAHQRKIACKTPTNAASCYWARGRLSYYNGTPAFRLWKVGTHRLLGIYSGPSVDRYGEDNESPELPQNVKVGFGEESFGLFEVCPLEPERDGAMQAACIETAKNIFVQTFDK